MNALEIVAASLLLSIVASGLLAAGCTVLARARRLRAGVAQWIWFSALVLTALLPVAGGISAMARAHAVAAATPSRLQSPSTGILHADAPPAQKQPHILIVESAGQLPAAGSRKPIG